jgi:hypothetical protein
LVAGKRPVGVNFATTAGTWPGRDCLDGVWADAVNVKQQNSAAPSLAQNGHRLDFGKPSQFTRQL